MFCQRRGGGGGVFLIKFLGNYSKRKENKWQKAGANGVMTFKVFYLPTDAQESCFKGILKFPLKQLLHVSVQSPSSGSVLFELAKVIVINVIS
jgi:hypothetical protein